MAKGKWIRKALWGKFWLLLLIIFSLLIIREWMQFRKSDQELFSYFSQRSLSIKIGYNEVEDRKIRFIELGNENGPLVAFIHGAPGSMTGNLALIDDSTFNKEFNVMAIDRPGYGYSEYGEAELSIHRQAQLIADVLQQKKNGRKLILVGVSYGGPVAARIAMDYEELVDGLLLVSASVAPKAEKIYGISYFIDLPFMRWLMPPAVRVANDEKLNHEKELIKMVPLWEKINAPTIIIHGEKDDLIYPENAFFAIQKIQNAPVDLQMVPNYGHMVAWDHPEIVKEAIFQLRNKMIILLH